jgi:hypothetical protein
MTDFGEIKPIDIREIWPNEATDFTPWLVENIERLGQALGMEIEVEEREADVGDFSLDIRAKDLGTGRTVIIENQLTETDHDHLGKLLTYAGGFDAGVLVWIAKELRDEHRKALEWLNDNTGADIDCFGVVIEVIRIDESKPAFNFKPVVFPNEWQKDKVGGDRHPASRRGEAYRAYFQSLIDELRTNHKFTNAKVGQPQNWYSFSSGVRGVIFSNSFAQGGKVRVELYIDLQDKDLNKKVFDRMQQQQAAIEEKYGAALTWERLDDRRACRIAVYRDGSIDDPAETQSQVKQWSIDNLLLMRKVLLPKAKEVVATVGG